MKQLLTLLLLTSFAASKAQTTIDLKEVANHVGDSVKLTGKIFSVKQLTNAKGAPTLINLGAAHPNHCQPR
jgi:hypothetical protein